MVYLKVLRETNMIRSKFKKSSIGQSLSITILSVHKIGGLWCSVSLSKSGSTPRAADFVITYKDGATMPHTNTPVIKPFYEDDTTTIYNADCRLVMASMPANSVDAIITDPPYGMNKGDWDGKDYLQEVGPALQQAWLTLKVNAPMFVFTSTAEVVNVANALNQPLKRMFWMYKPLVLRIQPGATIIDPYMGSGTTGVACAQEGRNFIGIEINEEYCELAVRRIKEAKMQPALFGGVANG